jgi:hypothetical protein
MTLVSEIVEEAFREGNFVGENNNPAPRQAREAIRSLNSMITNIWGGDSGERLTDWPLGAYGRQSTDDNFLPCNPDRPGINRRLIAVNETALTIYLTAQPQDGSRMGVVDPFSRLAAYPLTLDGNGRPIEGTATLVLDTNGLNREWLYRADLGSWVRLSGLAAADQMPFPDFFDDMFVVLLAITLAPRFGKEIAATSALRVKSAHSQFLARYVQSQPLDMPRDISWPFMSRQSYDTQGVYSSTGSFNRGRPY